MSVTLLYVVPSEQGSGSSELSVGNLELYLCSVYRFSRHSG